MLNYLKHSLGLPMRGLLSVISIPGGRGRSCVRGRGETGEGECPGPGWGGGSEEGCCGAT